MNRGILIPSSAEVELVCLRQQAGAVLVELRAHQSSSSCPSCGMRSSVRIWKSAMQKAAGTSRCSGKNLQKEVSKVSHAQCAPGFGNASDLPRKERQR